MKVQRRTIVGKSYEQWRLSLIKDEVGLPDCPCGSSSLSQVAGFYFCTCPDGTDRWYRFDCKTNMWVEDPNPFKTTIAES